MPARKVLKTVFGDVEERLQGEPAPLNCEGDCHRLTMHEFVGCVRAMASDTLMGNEHDFYRCVECGYARIWG